MIACDTNVLIYSADEKAGRKHEIATQVVAAAMARGDLLVPLQVQVEFVNILTRKLRRRPEEALGFLDDWDALAQVEAYTRPDIRAAVEAHRSHDIPLWDALIWAVCDRVGAEILVTEDFQNGRKLGRVTLLNPFDPMNADRLGLDRA